jgi:aromatic amino acid lyase
MVDGVSVKVSGAAGAVGGIGHTPQELERRIQDPYSIRCAPHVIGVLRDTIAWAEDWVTTSKQRDGDRLYGWTDNQQCGLRSSRRTPTTALISGVRFAF